MFSEISHYKLFKIPTLSDSGFVFIHLESGQKVQLSESYVDDFLMSGDSFNKEIFVGKEDKLWTAKQIADADLNNEFTNKTIPKVGDIRVKGIRTIWEELVTPHVFTVCFKKQNKTKTKKALNDEKEAKIKAFVEEIERVKIHKKGVADAASKLINDFIDNPILPYEEGEERIFRGYKIQFTSRDGKYNCVDIDIEENDKENNIRPVNINTISFLIYNNVKYIVKD